MVNPPLEHARDDADMQETLTRIQKHLASLHYENREKFPMWTIYGPGTTDHPGIHVMRLFLTVPEMGPTNCLVRGANAEQLRGLLPDGLTRLPRQPDDDRNIIEVWL